MTSIVPTGYSEEFAAFINSLPESNARSITLGGMLLERLQAHETDTGELITPGNYMLQLEFALKDCRDTAEQPIDDLASWQRRVTIGEQTLIYRFEGWLWAGKAFGPKFGRAVMTAGRQIMAKERGTIDNPE